MVFRGNNWSTPLIPPSKQGKQGLCQKQTKKDARQDSRGRGAQPEASQTSLRAPQLVYEGKVVYDHKKWPPRPLCPSRPRQQGMVRKPGQKENGKRSRDKARDRRLQKSKTSLKEGKVVYDHKKVGYRPLPPFREGKTRFGSKPNQKGSKTRR